MIKTELLLKKKEQTNISLSVLSSQSKNKSDTLSNTVVVENKKIDTNNVLIGIPTIQKSVPKCTGTMSTKNNITGGNEKEKSSSSGKIRTTGKNSFIDLIDLDGKINTKKTIYNRKSNIDSGTDTTTNITNFVDTPAESNKTKIVQPGNNKKYENNEDSIFTDQKVERREEDIKGGESSQHHDIDCVEFFDTLNFDNADVDDDYINYLDQTI